MSLEKYKQKRTFSKTPEPKGGKEATGNALRFVIQKHQARRLHYDFRLELEGVLKSWAVPKGIPESSEDKRLAIHVEDHPLAYMHFSGTIPEGNYGAGTVEIWDIGTYIPINEKEQPISPKEAIDHLHKGELKIRLKGRKVEGVYVLIHLKNSENWFLLKHSSKLEKRVKPMLATLHEGKPFDGKDWLFEIKWDGYRTIAYKKKDEVQVYSRNGLLLSDYPIIVQQLKKWKEDFLLDGEIVVLDEEGRPSFQLLQQYKENPTYPLVYYVFDILQLNGKSLVEKKLIERKKQLLHLINRYHDPMIRYSDHILEKGIDFFNAVKELGLEGILAKKIDSKYVEHYRSKEWLKLKNVQTLEAIIVGYTAPSGSRSAFGALVLAEQINNALTYIGHVGTGFTEQTLRQIKDQLDAYKVDTPACKEKIKLNAPVTWINPVLICTVKYTERTKSGILRHPVFLGMRPDKQLEDVQMETDDVLKKIDGNDVKLTHLQKMYWPEDKITKGDLLAYYEQVAPIILPYLTDRPLSLKRMPNGIHSKGFYHKDAGENAPSFVQTAIVDSDHAAKQIDYIVCNNAATLLYVANLGSIEMNPWNSTRKKPDYPTYIVIDLDPSEKNSFDQVVEVALVAYEILEKAGIPSFPKTSGATGLHIYIPMGNKYTYEEAKEFAHILAMLIQAKLPAITTIERMVKKRGAKIYIDYLQNAIGQTLASAYSVRPVLGAQVSAPLLWKDVKKGLHPAQFSIRNMWKRIQKQGDLFQGVLQKGIDMKNAIKHLETF